MLVSPGTSRHCRGVEAGAVVLDLERQPSLLTTKAHHNLGRIGVLLHVLKRLEHAEVHRCFHILGIALHILGVNADLHRRFARL